MSDRRYPASEYIETVVYKGHRLTRYLCTCGATFHCFEGEFGVNVHSDGHPRAGNLLDRLIALRELVELGGAEGYKKFANLYGPLGEKAHRLVLKQEVE